MTQRIAQWLEGLSLGKYAQVFTENDIDLEVLADLEEADLKEIGVTLGHRKRILRAISDLTREKRAAKRRDRVRTSDGAERRQLTVMFCDLVGSTALSNRFDPEEMRDLFLAYQNAVAREIVRFDGHVAKFMGDGILAYFGWPVAHEDSSERAVRAGLSVMLAMPGLRTPVGDPLAARIGISTGLVVVGDLIGEGASREETVVGETPNLAARLQGVAEPGQIVIAEPTKDLLGGGFELETLPPRRLKGISDPVTSYIVRGERAYESRFEARPRHRLVPMVGRDRELAFLVERWRQARSGDGQALLLVGEAGIGKSRLTHALTDTVAPEDHYLLRLQCSPHHVGSALWPVIRHLSIEASLDDNDSDDEKLDKIEALVSQRSGNVPEATALIAELLGVDGKARYGQKDLTPLARRVRTLAVLADQLVQLASTQAVLFVIEDAHWIDPTTKELVDLCLQRLDGAKIMVLMTSRPDNKPDFSTGPVVDHLPLEQLTRPDVEKMVSFLSDRRHLPPAAVDAILVRSDGIPLFIEEMTSMLLDRAADYSKSLAIEAADIPSSIQDMLLMRLDQLGSAKGLAQQAACFGRYFSTAQLSAMSGVPEVELELKMLQLTKSGLVEAVEDNRSKFFFKHALVQEAAYASLLRSKRTEIHQKIAQLLASDSAVNDPAVLAHHFSKGSMPEKAVEYWQAAGAQAMHASAFVEASTHFSRALEQLRKLPETAERDESEIVLLLSLGDPLVATRGFAAPEVSETFGRAREICQSLEKPDLQFPVLWGLVSFHIVRGELEKAHELASQFLDLGKAADMDDLVLTGNYLVGATYFWRGNFERALHPVRDFVERANPETDISFQIAPTENPIVDNMSYLAWDLWLLGYPDQGLSFSHRCIDFARGLNSYHDVAYALGFAAWCSQYRREYGRVRELAKEIIDLAEEQEFPYWLSASKILKGGGLAREGQFKEGLREIEEGFAIWTSTGSRLFKPSFLQVKAEALMLNGDLDASRSCVEEALDAIEATGETLNVSELRRMMGMLFEERGDLAEAERWYQEAIAVAVAQKAKVFELRATGSLARIWRRNNRGNEARGKLGDIYAWFTEGFDSPDLRDARDLLQEFEAL